MQKSGSVKYYLDDYGRFVIEDFSSAKPFSSFFPGIAGLYGIPMWAFYTNRGQAIASFGTRGKANSILEFQPANKAYYLTQDLGFRTFIKIKNKNIFYEPFKDSPVKSFNTIRRMYINSYDLTIQEINKTLGLEIEVNYFTLPNEPFAALVRSVSVKNISKKKIDFQIIDGLPQVMPFGMNGFFMKEMSRTIEAWFKVENLQNNVPLYKLTVDAADVAETKFIDGGNFYVFFDGLSAKPIKPIVDPACVFGIENDFSNPAGFLNKDFIFPKNQVSMNKTPSAFGFAGVSLNGGASRKFVSCLGCARSSEKLNSYVSTLSKPRYIQKKAAENAQIIQDIQSYIATSSSSREFDLYAGQTFLDNVLRGGLPITISNSGEPKIFHVYSRKHGDLERDYNNFYVAPTYFSQGNGNYRDLNQNRRNDVFFNPDVRDSNIITFLNLIQLDGYNPLVLKEIKFIMKDILIAQNAVSRGKEALKEFFKAPFSPGELLGFIEDNNIKLNVAKQEFLKIILSNSAKTEEADFQEGFWIDHWTYNLDLIESYLSVYPENIKEILFDKKEFTFFDNHEVVKPRSEKYVLSGNVVRQYGSVGPDKEKEALIKSRKSEPKKVRAGHGKGEIYKTTLLTKLLCLIANKISTLDPFGCGIEMEAGKPGWCDSLNGLPGLLGSSSCEVFELRRLIIFLKDSFKKLGIRNDKYIELPQEIHAFIAGLKDIMGEKDFDYWDKSNLLKEEYRLKTKLGITGEHREISIALIEDFFNKVLEKLNKAIERAKDQKSGLYRSYFINDVVRYEQTGDSKIRALEFKQRPVPLFLECIVHAIKAEPSQKEVEKINSAVKESGLYDKKIKMHKICESLESAPLEIGRSKVFTPGWLENETIWLHMEYKYILELLRKGLYEEFYTEFKNCIIAFRDPQEYGRSILENSSFIVSSAFFDKNLHGNGFVARLSGSTAEFLHMWILMCVGKEPFFLNEKRELNLKFSPALPGWLFKKDGTFSFKFLGKIPVTLHNPKRKNTFGKNGVCIKEIVIVLQNPNKIKIQSDILNPELSRLVRQRKVSSIDIYFGA